MKLTHKTIWSHYANRIHTLSTALLLPIQSSPKPGSPNDIIKLCGTMINLTSETRRFLSPAESTWDTLNECLSNKHPRIPAQCHCAFWACCFVYLFCLREINRQRRKTKWMFLQSPYHRDPFQPMLRRNSYFHEKQKHPPRGKSPTGKKGLSPAWLCVSSLVCLAHL